MTGDGTAPALAALVDRARRLIPGTADGTPGAPSQQDPATAPWPGPPAGGREAVPAEAAAAVVPARDAAAPTRAPHRAILGVAGPPGAGKSTLAAALVAALCARSPGVACQVPMDGFHLADVELDRLGRARRKGAPDTFDAAGFTALLTRLRAETADTVYAPAFDREIEQPVAGSIPVDPAVRLVVTEGNYLLEDGPWAGVRALLDEVWWVEAPEAERVERLTVRHERSGRTPPAARAWADEVDDANARLIAPSRARADLVVPGDLPLP